MKVNKFHDKKIKENYINIYYNILDTEILRVLNFFDENKKIIGKNSEQEKIFNPSDVYYFEIVDRRCFAYLHSSIFIVDLSLQNIIDRFGNEGFVRISKSMIINIFQVKELKSDINMRVNVILENGETVIVNRNYKKDFYKRIRVLYERGSDFENN